MKPERTDKYKSRVTLLGTIANGSTAEARKLLKRSGEQDAVNHKDLEYKLTKLYQNEDDKLALEKQLAEIHPHKEFILKYTAPQKEEMIKETISEEMPVETKMKSQCSCGNPDCPNNYSNCCGSSSMSGTSSACGCKSNFSADTEKTINSNDAFLVLGLVAIISIFALTNKR